MRGSNISTARTSDEDALLLLLLRKSLISRNDLSRQIRGGKTVWAIAADLHIGVDTLFDSDEHELLEARAWGDEQRTIQGRDFFTLLDPRYPVRLLAMSNPPPVIFIQGAIAIEDASGVALIGTREPSVEGRAIALDVATALATSGTVVVSGLAAGIDRAAHEGALAAGGRTVAVIGTGLDQAYPRDHASLQEEIAAQHLVISQFWPDAGPTKIAFPLRNELMASYAGTTCIIEAGERSGARIQARAAIKQGRRLFVHELMRREEWAQELVARGSAHWFRSAEQLV